MIDWVYVVDLYDIWHNADLSLVNKAHMITARIRHSEWFKDLVTAGDLTLDEALDGLDHAQDEWEFDEAWDYIYDLADIYGAWINTIEDHQNERVVRTDKLSRDM